MSDNALRAKIALDGLADVNRQLKEIGDNGKSAFSQAADAARQAGAGIGSAQSAVSSFSSAFDTLARSVLGGGLGLGAAFKPFIAAASQALAAGTRAGAGLAAIAAGASGVSAAIGKIGQEAANSVAKLNDAATAVGLTADKYSALRAAFQGVGVTGDVLDKMVEASDKASRQAEIAGGPSRVRDNPFFKPQGKAASGVAEVKRDIDGLKESVLGAERDLNTLPTVWTQVNGTLQQIHPEFGPAKAGLRGYAQAAQDLGVALRDMYGKARPGIEVARDVVLALSKMSDSAQRTDIAVRAFGESLATDVLSIADDNEAVNRLAAAHEAAAANFSDAQQKQAEEARRTGAVLASVKASWVEYFRALAIPVTIDQNNAILGFFERNKAALKDFGDNVVGPAIRWLGRFQNAFGVTALAAGALGSSMGLLSPLSASVFGVAGAAALLFGDNIKNGALGAMTELTRIVKTNDLSTFAGLKSAAQKVWEDIKQIASAAWTALKKKIQTTDWHAVWEGLKASAIAVWGEIKAAATEAYETIKTSLLTAFPDLAKPWAEMESAAGDAWNIVKTVILGIPQAFKAIVGVANELAGIINSIFGTHFTGAGLLATAIIAEFGSKLIPIPGWLQTLALVLLPVAAGFTGVAAAIRGGVSAIDFVLGKIQQLTDALSGMLMWALRQLVGEDLWDAMRSAAASALKAISQALDDLASAAKSAWAAMKSGGPTAWEALKAKASEFWRWLDGKWSSVKSLGGSAWDGLKAKASETWTAIKTSASSLWDSLKSGASAALGSIASSPAWRAIADASTSAWRGLEGAAQSAASRFGSMFSGIVGKIAGATSSALDKAHEIAAAIHQALDAATIAGNAGRLSLALVSPFAIAAESIGKILDSISAKADATLAKVIAALSAAPAAMQQGSPSASPANPSSSILASFWREFGVGRADAAEAPHPQGGKDATAAVTKSAAQIRDLAVSTAQSVGAPFIQVAKRIAADFSDLKSMAASSIGAIATDAQQISAVVVGAASRAGSSLPGGSSGAGRSAPVGPDESKRIPGTSEYDLNYSAEVDSPDGSSPASREYDREMGYAGGGHVIGPGTSTSDSIFAKLSNGEFVMSARAAAHWGVGLLNDLNNLRLPRFATGGAVGTGFSQLIGGAMPAFDLDGMFNVLAVASNVPTFVNRAQAQAPSHAGLISFTLGQGDQKFELMGRHDIVRQLERHAVATRISATTKRSASWHGG